MQRAALTAHGMLAVRWPHSLFPLLKRDGLSAAYAVSVVLWVGFAWMLPKAARKDPRWLAGLINAAIAVCARVSGGEIL